MSFEHPVYLRIMLLALALAIVGLVAGMLWRRWLARAPLLVIGGMFLALAGYAYWFNNRRQPAAYYYRPAPGISYHRYVSRLPDGAPLVAHVASIDRERPGFRLGLAAMPIPGAPARGLNLTATVPSRLLQQSGATLLINGDFFGPWEDKGPQEYRPHAGDLCETRGLAMAHGVVLNLGESPGSPGLWVDRQGEIHIGPPIDTSGLVTAISGAGVLVRQGQPQPEQGIPAFTRKRHPRSVVGLSQDGRTLFFLVIDGRQPGSSAGLTWDETAEISIANGLETALMLDGGGSSTLVIMENGRPRVLNSPIHNTIPGRERPIANALVVH